MLRKVVPVCIALVGVHAGVEIEGEEKAVKTGCFPCTAKKNKAAAPVKRGAAKTSAQAAPAVPKKDESKKAAAPTPAPKTEEKKKAPAPVAPIDFFGMPVNLLGPGPQANLFAPQQSLNMGYSGYGYNQFMTPQPAMGSTPNGVTRQASASFLGYPGRM